MKIGEDTIEITPAELIFWREIKTIRLVNERLTFFLDEGRVVEVAHVHPSLVDAVFRAYEHYLQKHPTRKSKS